MGNFVEKLHNIYIYRLSSSIKLSKVFRILASSSLVILLALSYLFLNPTILVPNSDDSVHATDTPATSGEAVNSLVTLNLSLTRPNASLELTPHDTNGTFASSSASSSAEFDVSTNNYTGYTLSLASSTNNDDDGKLTNTDTNIVTNNTLSSISSVTSESDFSSSSSFNNKWGYKPSRYNGSDNTSYIPAPSITNPSTSSAILDTTATYNTTTNGQPITTETSISDINTNTYTIGLGARVDSTVATGSYEGTFVLQVVGNPVPVTITYTDTSGDSTVTSTLPAKYEGEVSETRSPISTTIPTRTGYTFKSWCLGTVTAGTSENNYVDTCTGTTYNPSTTENTQYIGVDLTHSNTMTLVAMWERQKYLQTVQVRYQDTTGTYGAYSTYAACTADVYYGDTHSCSIAATTEYQAATLASYTVTGDDTKQMDVARQTYRQTIQARYQNTSGGWGSYGDYSSCTKDVYYGAAHSCSIAATTEYKAASVASYTVTGANTKQMDVARQTYTQTIQIRYQNASGGWGSYSNYSSCTKAVYYGANHSCSVAASTTYAATSVSSYKVTGAATKQMSASRNTRTVKLTKGTGVSAVTVTGTGVKSGSGTASATAYYGGAVTITATMSSGYDWVNWTGSATYTSRAQSISSVTSNLSFTANGKASCTSSISGTMQAFNPSKLCSNAATSGTLSDSRDSKSYTVAKIGSLWWMTKNLDLAGGTTLTSSTSNVSSNYTLPSSNRYGFNGDSTASVYNSGSTTCSKTSSCYSYYNYLAATAGGNGSVCPKGWRLPTQSELNSLKSSYSTGATLTASPWNGVYNGYFNNGSFLSGGTYGRYISSTASGDEAYSLYYGSSSAGVQTYMKRQGGGVRCVR